MPRKEELRMSKATIIFLILPTIYVILYVVELSSYWGAFIKLGSFLNLSVMICHIKKHYKERNLCCQTLMLRQHYSVSDHERHNSLKVKNLTSSPCIEDIWLNLRRTILHIVWKIEFDQDQLAYSNLLNMFKKAFDATWHQGLIYQLHNDGVN